MARLFERGHLSQSPFTSGCKITYAHSIMSDEATKSDQMAGLLFANPRSSVASIREERPAQALIKFTQNSNRVESDHKEAFLLRHFAETVGHW